MDKKIIKDILQDQTEEKKRIQENESIIDRDQLKYWKKSVNTDLVTVTMGSRRAGKTVFTHLLLKGKDHAFVNFDDERLAFADKDDLNNILEALYEIYGDFKYLLLDEVQNITGWELFVNRLQRSGIKVFVTGSNANLLSRELSTYLTGRFIKIEIFPFSFREFLLYNGITEYKTTTKSKALLKKNLEDYIKIGGFPEVVKAPEVRTMYLTSLYSSIISRDIMGRHYIKFLKTFKEMSSTIISNFALSLTFNKLKNVHGFKSIHTAKNYVEYLTDAYLIFLVEKYSPKPKEITNSPKKVYVVDTGLINSISISSTENKGRLMENIVFIELLRKKGIDTSIEIFYWRDYQDHEVDFVIRKGKKVDELIQVTFVYGKNEIAHRELNSLVNASNKLKCNKLTVITWDYDDVDMIKGKKVKFISLYKWLLNIK